MSRRTRLREITLEEIKRIARQQMIENGTAAVSLSAIARQMEMTTPALYRYYASRDDLVTALIANAYNDLADALETASRDNSENCTYGRQLLAVLIAYRRWALEHAVDFELIYGNPIPSYQAPPEVTTPAARRGFAVILNILAAAYQARELKLLPEHLHLPEDLLVSLPPVGNEQSPAVPPEIIYLGVVGWTRIHGIIMLELFNHTRSLVSDPDAFYLHELYSLLNSIGMHPDQS